MPDVRERCGHIWEIIIVRDMGPKEQGMDNGGLWRTCKVFVFECRSLDRGQKSTEVMNFAIAMCRANRDWQREIDYRNRNRL